MDEPSSTRDVRTSADRVRIESEVRELFALQLAPAEELRDIGVDNISNWSGRSIDPDTVDWLIAAESARATKTYIGMIHLVLGGFGPQAAMLNRSLFEGTVIAHWITVEEATALDRFNKHARHNALLWVGAFEKVGWMEPAVLTEAERAERDELNGMFGPHGERNWTGHNLHTLTEKVAHLWDDGGEDLWLHYRIAHRDNNQVLHASHDALAGSMQNTGDAMIFDGFPSSRYITRALIGGFWAYLQTLSLVFDHFGMAQAREQVRHTAEASGDAFGGEENP
jgi:hypothetical protein